MMAALLVKRAWPSLTLDCYRRSWDRQWLLKPASDLHTLPQTQQTKSFGCAFPLCSSEPGAWCILRCLARPDRLLHTFPHSSHVNWLMNKVFQHSYADDWLGLRLTNILVHTFCIQTVTGLGRYCHLFLAALFVLAQIFALSRKHLSPPISVTLPPSPSRDRQFCTVLVSPWHSLWSVSLAYAAGGSQQIVLHTTAAWECGRHQTV